MLYRGWKATCLYPDDDAQYPGEVIGANGPWYDSYIMLERLSAYVRKYCTGC